MEDKLNASLIFLDHVGKAQESQVKNCGGVDEILLLTRDKVWTRNYGNKGALWKKGVIEQILGPRRIRIMMPELDLRWIRCVHQLRRSYKE